MVPLRPFPLLSTIIRDPAGSFICQTATGRSKAALAGRAITSAPARAIETVSILRRKCVPPERSCRTSPGTGARPVDCRIDRPVGTDALAGSGYATARTAGALELDRPAVVQHLEAGALPGELLQLPVVDADAGLREHSLVHRDRHPWPDPAQVVDRVGQLQPWRPGRHGQQLDRLDGLGQGVARV